MADSGSSPRVWGTLRVALTAHLQARFIPTGVGNTSLSFFDIFQSAVHPHGCGEHPVCACSNACCFGSSPRVWGTQHDTVTLDIGNRFIPTGVGNTATSASARSGSSVHPHGCGEHSSVSIACRVLLGSSPRVWGTRQQDQRGRQRRRFIPTGVGNTGSADGAASARSVHPHGCGEHKIRFLREVRSSGSSPRVWGTRISSAGRYTIGWFIPTGVGNTRRRQLRRCASSVHPHGCGEHGVDRIKLRLQLGSSPRVWGTPISGNAAIDIQRFIPTGVGNTLVKTASSRFGTVHPHGCGEHAARCLARRITRGSSPRVWGTLTLPLKERREERFIPTGVGNTAISSPDIWPVTVHPHGCGEH